MLKPTKTNVFKYKVNDGYMKGYFDVYQSRGGYIIIMMGNSYTKLSLNQIRELNIDVYKLDEFDYDLFKNVYEIA